MPMRMQDYHAGEGFYGAPVRGPNLDEGATRGLGQPGAQAGRGPKGWRRSDERILDDVCARLTDDEDVDASDLEVRVQEGVVHLEGSVPERFMKRRAAEIAEDIRGVVDVMNGIRVRAG